MKLNLTTLGKDMVLQCIEGGFTMVFSSIVIGNGDDAGSENSTMSNPLLEIPISNIERENEYVTLTGVFNNNSVTDRFRAKEIGVYAEYERFEGTMVKSLFAYGYSPDNEADLIPASSDYILETTEQVQVFVGALENLSAIISDSMVTVSKAEFDNHSNNQNNPHKVTATQVGLGNVPNVTTNDQTPTFTAHKTLEGIESGEKMSVLLGKIKLAISRLIEHLGKKGNPHYTTCDDIGAAKSSHIHSTTDIISGTLGIARGGTGVSSKTALKKLVAPYTGIYTGDGTGKRFISLDFTPTVVIIEKVAGFAKEADMENSSAVWGGTATTDIALSTGGSIMHFTTWYDRATAIMLTTNGFYVNYDIDGVFTNYEGITYRYIAFGG